MAAAKIDLPEQLGPSMAMTTDSDRLPAPAARFTIDETATDDLSRQASS
jgi:hypothetical protein